MNGHFWDIEYERTTSQRSLFYELCSVKQHHDYHEYHTFVPGGILYIVALYVFYPIEIYFPLCKQINNITQNAIFSQKTYTH